MEILPAIDLRGGKVVRLSQGDYDRQTTYSLDPLAVAQAFVDAGARWIHMVDLDAARSGQRTNAPAISAVCSGVKAQVELGGGIRDDADVAAALEMGVARVIIGSAALKDWPWFEKLARRNDLTGKVVLGLDARDGDLAVHGWTEQSGLSLLTVARKARELPLAAIVYTDISRDGLLGGPDLARTEELVKATELAIIASGGIRNLEDIRRCRQIGCAGAIVGRAHYEGKVDIAQACRIAQADR